MSHQGFKAGEAVTLRDVDGTGFTSPVMLIKRLGQYGDDVECVWFNRHSDQIGNVSYVGHAMWLSTSILEHVPPRS
jgi:uncharacterized protein YodC (DUF2158 family)